MKNEKGLTHRYQQTASCKPLTGNWKMNKTFSDAVPAVP